MVKVCAVCGGKMSENRSLYAGFNLSKDPETEGFDLQAGQTWIYPTNYPIREYQFNIVQKALLNNTLVSLPTGLGKTFIAAVVMYNFFRWYPMGKVIFMAPTRPLVKQQIDACYDIMAIPKEVTVELTGTKMATSRGDVWKEKRVFFITPQILQNDLDRLEELGPKIKCLVFDEAHRARGNHAYCQVVRKLVVHNKFFRVLALSATPGSTISDVFEVVQNLLISHLEFRTEESVDVHPYVYERNLTTIVVPFGEKLQKVRDDYLQILEYYTKVLMKYKVIQGNCGSLTKGKIFMTMKEFQKNRSSGSANYAEIMKSLNICVTLYHAFELLTRHGLRSFLSFFNEHIDKPLLRGNTHLVRIMNDVREYLGPEPNIEQLPDGSYPEVPNTVKFGHPKFYKLRDILVSHFTEADDSSRVIVFFEYRNSVTEAYMLLIQARPLLKPRIFLGQGQGVTQRLQLNVVKSFREGQCNILLSTCIGEEGLDVGDVDLIVCFDISNKSPIRMVQRMGRTGRKKKGQIVVLVTEGKEQQILKDCLIHKNNIAFHVLSSRELAESLKSSSPRLVPSEISPKCEKIHITVKKPMLTKTSSLKEMFRSISSSSSEPTFSPDLEIIEIPERIPEPQMLWDKEDPFSEDFLISNMFCKKIEKQRSFQPICEVNHSKGSEVLVELLQLVDSKRFNIPITQIGTISQLTQNLKQGDIRNMFLKPQVLGSDTVSSGSQAPKLLAPNPSPPHDNYLLESRELFSEMSNYLSIQMSNGVKKCRHCPDSFDCTTCTIDIPNVDFAWNQVEDSVLETITLEDINLFTESLSPNSKAIYNELEFKDFADLNLITSTQQKRPNDTFDGLEITQLEKMAEKLDANAEQIEKDGVHASLDAREKSYTYQAPKDFNLLLSRYSVSIIELPETPEEKSQQKHVTKQTNDFNGVDEHEIQKFFELENLSELFVEENKIYDSQETIVYSPDIFHSSFTGNKTLGESKNDVGKKESDDEVELSPVLRKFEKGRNLKKNKKLCTVNDLLDPVSPKSATTPRGSNLQAKKWTNPDIETPSKFTMNATKISTPFESKTEQNNSVKQLVQVDLKELGSKDRELNKIEFKDSPRKDKTQSIINIDEICDLSMFGLSPVKSCRTTSISQPFRDESEPVTHINRHQSSESLFSSTSSRASFDIDDFCDLMSFGIPSQKSKNDNNELNEHPSPAKAETNQVDLDKDGDLNDFASPIRSSNSVLRGASQSQLPNTQLLSLINRNEESPKSARTVCSPQRPSLDVKGSASISSHEGKAETSTRKTVLSGKKTVQPSSPVLKTKVRKNLNESFSKIIFKNLAEATNSDDDFEDRPPSPVFRKPVPVKPHTNNRKTVAQSSTSSPVRPIEKKKTKNPFVEEEAELSENEYVYVSEDEEDEEQNAYETSFVADETQHVDTQMQAKYLQSLMSPRNRNQGRFKFPQKQKFNVCNIYSQKVSHEDDAYLEDSFVVDEDMEPTQHELSELDILEQKLKERRKNKRRKSEDDTEPTKRRRILMPTDDSD